ncbi:diguanylate cyclase [Candidatus Magnetomorum sp. HK-1]|nr:diguanylate cyclase [Candidatus Magnetomorum sp. HK-1]
MSRNISLVFPIMGMQILLILCTTLSHYYIEMTALQDTITENEASKAEDIHFIVESLIDKEISKLSGLSKVLKNRTDLIDGLSQYQSKKDTRSIKVAMDMLFPQMEVDIFQAADRNQRVIYQAHDPNSETNVKEFHGVVEAMLAEDILMASQTKKGWAIRAIVPLISGDDLLGTITIGTWINDDYAQNISIATEVHVSIGCANGVIASSLPVAERRFINAEAMKVSILKLKPIREVFQKQHKNIYYAPMEMANEPFSLMVEIDTMPSFQLLEQNKTHIIKISILILLIAMSIAEGYTLYLLRPLKKLNSKVKETVKELAGIDLQAARGNELKTLVRSFNIMVKTISNHITERERAERALKRHKEMLEELVGERTTELEKSNSKLTITVKELEWRTNEILLLNKLGDLLHACDSEEETYQIVINICRQLFPQDSGYLCIFDDTQKVLRIVSSWGESEPEELEFEHNQCWAIRRGKEHFVQDPEVDPICPHLHFYPKDGCLCAPMSAQGEVLGMIHLCIGLTDVSNRTEDTRKHIIESKLILVKSMVERYAPSLINLRLRQTLKIQSIRDPLTGLYNRRHMQESLEREARRVERRSTSLGIIMIDVDHFKAFNDTYGHEAGDVVLKELGAFLKQRTRGEDIACRYGGEEFMLILTDANPDNTSIKAEEIRKDVKERLKIKHHGQTLNITISLGVAIYPLHGLTTEETLKAADMALYKAKANGRNCVAYAAS